MQNRYFVLAVVVLLLFSFVGCYTIQYVPNGEEVQGSKRVLFLFWGIAPLGNNTVKSGKPVTEKFTFVDYVITFFTLGIVSARTVESN